MKQKIIFILAFSFMILVNDVIFHHIGVRRGVWMACYSLVEDAAKMFPLKPEDKKIITEQCVEDFLDG